MKGWWGLNTVWVWLSLTECWHRQRVEQVYVSTVSRVCLANKAAWLQWAVFAFLESHFCVQRCSRVLYVGVCTLWSDYMRENMWKYHTLDSVSFYKFVKGCCTLKYKALLLVLGAPGFSGSGSLVMGWLWLCLHRSWLSWQGRWKQISSWQTFTCWHVGRYWKTKL